MILCLIFLLLDNKKYKKGENIDDFKVSNYIDEPNEILVQHLAHIYSEVLHIAMQFDIDEKEVNALAFENLDSYYPEDVKKLIKGRMNHYDITTIKRRFKMFKFVIYDKDRSRLKVNKNNISISTEFSGSKGQLIEYFKVVVERLFTFAIDNEVEEYLYDIIANEYRNRNSKD